MICIYIYIYDMTASLWWLNLRLMALQLPNKCHLGYRNPKFQPAGGLRLQRRHCRHGGCCHVVFFDIGIPAISCYT